jgi:hypothetical protein
MKLDTVNYAHPLEAMNDLQFVSLNLTQQLIEARNNKTPQQPLITK